MQDDEPKNSVRITEKTVGETVVITGKIKEIYQKVSNW